MKKSFLFLTAALLVVLGAASCNKNANESSEETPQGALTICVGIPDEETKVVANATNVKDFQINSVQVFIFDDAEMAGDGSAKLETDYYYTPASPLSNSVSVTVNTTTNYKCVYVVVNRSRMYRTRGVYTLRDFESELSDLAENSFTSLLMVGMAEVTVTEYNKNKNPNQTAQTLNIWVKRLVSMVKLNALTVDFGSSSLSGASFTLKEMYLKNAVGRSRFGLTNQTDMGETYTQVFPLSVGDQSNGNYWYNKHTLTEGCPAILLDNGCNESCNTAGQATAIGRCLFTYPNPTLVTGDSHSSSATWVPRLTRLTLKAHISKNANGVTVDEDTYYTFDLPVLTANKVYNIQNIHITQMGKDNDDTDQNLQGGQLAPAITVDPWDDDVVNLNYEF